MATTPAEASDDVLDIRLQHVLQQLDAGIPLTVAAMGGSITTGYAADPPLQRGWAAQVAAWLGRRGIVRYVNAAASGTDSAAAVQRLQAHVLDAAPDLVFVEFSVNDEWLATSVRAASFEGLLRQLLSAPKPPAVVALLLTQQGNRPRDTVVLQQRLARHYGLTSIDFGAWMQRLVDSGAARWEALYDEPVHPHQTGHDAIAQAVLETLQAALSLPAAAAGPPAEPTRLPEPLYSRTHEFVRTWAGDALKPWRNLGFVRGGEVHDEWAALPGGLQPGWTATHDEAEASWMVCGSEIAVFHAESEHYRNLQAWVDDGRPVTLQGHVPERQGYLGWKYSVVAQGLEPGAHLLHVRMKCDGWAGSGRLASVLAVMAAGVMPQALRSTAFEPLPDLQAASGWRLLGADHPRLVWVGRFDTLESAAPLLAWSGTELRARFSGTKLALRLAAVKGTSHFTVEVDGRSHLLSVQGDTLRDWRLTEPLPPGPHTLRLVKRSEAAFGEARLLGLWLAADGQLLEPPPPRALRLEFYGDSITAGACNGDIGPDQYDDLVTHDGMRAYGALVAQQVGADYLGIAISGTGITRTYGEPLMPQVWNRTAPRMDAPLAPVGPRTPDVVVVNLGQNDHGHTASRGEPFPGDFGPRYLDFVRALRVRYPAARLVLCIGGITGTAQQPQLQHSLQATAAQLRAQGDAQVWTYTFQAHAPGHPRLDVHALMANELRTFLLAQVLR